MALPLRALRSWMSCGPSTFTIWQLLLALSWSGPILFSQFLIIWSGIFQKRRAGISIACARVELCRALARHFSFRAAVSAAALARLKRNARRLAMVAGVVLVMRWSICSGDRAQVQQGRFSDGLTMWSRPRHWDCGSHFSLAVKQRPLIPFNVRNCRKCSSGASRGTLKSRDKDGEKLKIKERSLQFISDFSYHSLGRVHRLRKDFLFMARHGSGMITRDPDVSHPEHVRDARRERCQRPAILQFVLGLLIFSESGWF